MSPKGKRTALADRASLHRMRWTVTAHLMPPRVNRLPTLHALDEGIARRAGGEWNAEPLEAALIDIRRQKPEGGGPFPWTTYHRPGYRITVPVAAADAESARHLALD
jgi:hypothetical protein